LLPFGSGRGLNARESGKRKAGRFRLCFRVPLITRMDSSVDDLMLVENFR